MKLFGRLMTIFAVLAILPMVVMGGVWLMVQRHRLMAEERHQVELMTYNAAAEIDLELARAVEQVQQLAASLAEEDGLQEADRRYEGLDESTVKTQMRELDHWWPQVPDSSELVRAGLTNPTAGRLRRFASSATTSPRCGRSGKWSAIGRPTISEARRASAASPSPASFRSSVVTTRPSRMTVMRSQMRSTSGRMWEM